MIPILLRRSHVPAEYRVAKFELMKYRRKKVGNRRMSLRGLRTSKGSSGEVDLLKAGIKFGGN